jgi:saccharopine dehydrogenase-like NADP-dependent oxidoreductase
MKKVLVLGAGLVAKPLIDYLAGLEDINLTVADIVLRKATSLTADHENAAGIEFDASDDAGLSTLIKENDFAVSLLPGSQHARVARLCLEHGRSMSTASYVTQAFREMHAEVADKGLMFINECGASYTMLMTEAAWSCRSAHTVVVFLHPTPTPIQLATSFRGRPGECSKQQCLTLGI